MDWDNLVVQITAIVGAIATLIAIANGIYELREHRRKNRKATSGEARPAQPEAPPPAQQPAPSVARAGNLPIPSTPLIGRNDELAQLQALLLRPDVRLVPYHTGYDG